MKARGASKPPRAPKGLSKNSRQLWQRVWRSRVAEAYDPDSDIGIITRWIRNVDRHERLSAAFDRNIMVPSTSRSGTTFVINPLSNLIKQLEDRICAAETQLGLTPMARNRLGVQPNHTQIVAAAFVAQLEATRPGPVELLPREGDSA